MANFFFYNNRKPRKFNYKPILYNPEEEDRKKNLEDRIERMKREMGVLPQESPTEKREFKSDFVSQTHHLRKRKDKEAAGQRSFFGNTPLLVIILAVLLALLVFWFLR